MLNSVLSPSVAVEEGAVVKDSIIFRDCLIDKNASHDLVISDKLTRIKENAAIGVGEHHDIASRLYPKHLYTGIKLIGEFARPPVGRKLKRHKS